MFNLEIGPEKITIQYKGIYCFKTIFSRPPCVLLFLSYVPGCVGRLPIFNSLVRLNWLIVYLFTR